MALDSLVKCKFQEPIEYERIDCTPNMCCHSYAMLRWFEMVNNLPKINS